MADPRPGAGRPLTTGQRPTGASPAADPVPAPPAIAPALGASPPVSTGSRAAASAEIQARTSGLKLRSQPQDVKQRLREGALDTVLNAAGLLADTWDDFRNRDRYFKYKAGIIAAWVFLSITSFFIAFPGSAANRLGAHLVKTEVAGRPVYMIKNDSRSAWHEVTVVVNRSYRTAAGSVEPNGGTLTFNLRQLKGDNDTAVPPDLPIRDLQLRTDDGDVWLIKDGEERH